MLAGCGDDEGTPAVGSAGEPGEGGTLVWALDGRVRAIDPLLARSRSERLVARQVYEPLVARLGGPFDDARRSGGLALGSRPARDPTAWRVVLRPEVRFQDGTRLNAAAVLANVERWRATAAGRRLLPGLLTADAPRPHLVRFVLSDPDPRFDRRLASPRLGIVSPRALGEDPGPRPLRAQDAGTGAFELRERERERLLLARNTSWWGSARGLGPALGQVELLAGAGPNRRAELLIDGDAQVADGLEGDGAARVDADPLLLALPHGGGAWRGLERSVRGIESGRAVPYLQRVWLTSLGS